MNENTIRIECTGATTVDIDELNDLQGEEFKTLTEQDYVKLRNSIMEYGFSFPLFLWIDTDGKKWTIDGHQRSFRVLGKMRKEGWTIPPLPADIINAKDKVEAKKKLLLLNSRYGKMTESGMTDFVNEEGFEVDMGEMGDFLSYPEFDMGEFVQESTVEDEAPGVDMENPAVSQVGEVYQLGRHKLMCGDATKIENVEKLMGGQKADMVFMDPPYGMNLQANFEWSKGNESMGIKPSKGYSQVIGDDKDFDASFIFTLFGYCKEIFLWGADYYIDTLPNFGKDGGWIVWDKKNDDLKDVWTNEFELLWSKQQHKREVMRVLWNGALGTESEDIENRVHPTQKPIRVCEPVIRKYSQEGQSIVDLFGGSGSILIACEQINRVCFMMELDPKYCDVIRKRYAKFVGKETEWQAITPSIA